MDVRSEYMTRVILLLVAESDMSIPIWLALLLTITYIVRHIDYLTWLICNDMFSYMTADEGALVVYGVGVGVDDRGKGWVYVSIR